MKENTVKDGELNMQNNMIKSLLDNDQYKFNMCQVVFHYFPEVQVKYKFIDRNNQDYPEGMADAVKEEIKYLSQLKLTKNEKVFLSHHHMKPDYLDWLETFQFNPEQVEVKQVDKKLNITITGPWKETIFWEVPLMAIISELYYKLNELNVVDTYYGLPKEKATKLSEAGVKWTDFGTRRRYSFALQYTINEVMRNFPGYLGTSNVYLAKLLNVKPVGTSAHEAVMAMEAKYGFRQANRKWLEFWMKEYGNELSIALTDTLTTDVFLRDFDYELASKFNGVRQDSGNPYEFGEKIVKHYEKLGIDAKTKTIIFSDALTTDKAIGLHKCFSGRINTIFGIGTHFTNDTGHKPLNIVIKMHSADFGDGFKNVIKLSDDIGKHTGDLATIKAAKEELYVGYIKINLLDFETG